MAWSLPHFWFASTISFLSHPDTVIAIIGTMVIIIAIITIISMVIKLYNRCLNTNRPPHDGTSPSVILHVGTNLKISSLKFKIKNENIKISPSVTLEVRPNLKHINLSKY